MRCFPLIFSLDGLIASAFLDRNQQYAKRDEDLVTVRLFYTGGADSPGPVEDLTAAQFASLSEEDQQAIRDAGTSVTVNL